MQDISMFDIVVVTLTLLLAIKGLFKGFVKEFFGLVGIIGGIFVASRLAVSVGEKIAPLFAIENESSIELMGFVAALIGFWIIAYALGTVISKVFSLSGLGVFDRILGFAFGAFKVFLIFSVIIYALSQVQVIKEKIEESVGNTITYPILLAGGAYIIKLDKHVSSGEMTKSLDEAVENTKQGVENLTKEVIIEEIQEATQGLQNNSTSQENSTNTPVVEQK